MANRVYVESMEALACRLGCPGVNRQLLEQALTHPSYAAGEDNQRLEYLGDAVLQLVAAQYLFTSLPQATEGQLTKARAGIVSEEPLAATARELGVGSVLRLGPGEEKTNGRNKNSLLADAMEALFAVLYLHLGLPAAAERILYLLSPRIEECLQNPAGDAKSSLQELLQRRGKSARYTLLSENGPPHQPVFYSAVWEGENELGRGQGSTRKKSEQAAAKAALQILEQE